MLKPELLLWDCRTEMRIESLSAGGRAREGWEPDRAEWRASIDGGDSKGKRDRPEGENLSLRCTGFYTTPVTYSFTYRVAMGW